MGERRVGEMEDIRQEGKEEEEEVKGVFRKGRRS